MEVVLARDRSELTGLAAFAVGVVERLDAVGVSLLVAAENLFPPLPGEVILPLAGRRKNGPAGTGQRAVLVARCVPGVRSLISVPAGVEWMPVWRFSAYTLIGSDVLNYAVIAVLPARFRRHAGTPGAGGPLMTWGSVSAGMRIHSTG